MSNAIRFDPLLVRYLAEELDARLRGRLCAAAPLFASDRTVVLPLDRDEALVLDLHPGRGWVRLLPWESPAEELDAVCQGAEAPTDERRLGLRIHSGDRFRAQARRLEIELHTNQWNALLVAEEDQRILSLVWQRVAGARDLRAGVPYTPPPASGRLGAGEVQREVALARWMELLERPEGDRAATLVRNFAYTGTTNAGAILGRGGELPLEEAFDRWWWMRSLPPARPVVAQIAGRPLPYPFPLPDTASVPAESLLAAMAAVADAASSASRPEPAAGDLDAVQRRISLLEQRIQRLEEQWDRVGEGERLRSWGDLLLARKRLVPRGADSVKIRDWSGGLVEIPLDPALSAAENAARWYNEARKRSRAEQRLPELLDRARAELDRWRAARVEVERGETPEWLAKESLRAERTGSGAEDETSSRPFRSYRTSGGLEVRVGRSARDNDRLTFGHSSPNDVWLHARSVPGSHVILRWPDAEASPPARDLSEAATLAALFSKARSSALVPVDWTRRKYVRKPRGAPPGSVIPQRVKTLFVEPDERLEEQMRAEADRL